MGARLRTRLSRPGQGIFGLAVLTGLLASFGAATAVGAFLQETPPEVAAIEAEQGPATPHVKVGEGSTPGNGRFEVYRATTASGEECFGIKLFNQPGASDGVLFEGCGNPNETDIGSNTGHGETIIYGRVPKSADKIELDVAGKAKKIIKAKESTADVPYRYFLTVYSERLKSARATVTDAGGRIVGEQEIPLPLATTHE